MFFVLNALYMNYEDVEAQMQEGHTMDELLELQNHWFGLLVKPKQGTTAYTLLQVRYVISV